MFTKYKCSRVHRHVPERVGGGSGQKRKRKVSQRDNGSKEGGDLHENPTGVDVRMKLCVAARVGGRPKMKLTLEAVHGERSHTNGDRDEQSGGNPKQ